MGRRPIFRAALVPTAAVLRTGELQIAAYLEQVRANSTPTFKPSCRNLIGGIAFGGKSPP
jgi:hypothetical protein